MRVLLDTNAFLWFVLDEPQLTKIARTIIEDPSNDVSVSPATYWELAIKIRLGKYALPLPFQTFMESQIAVNDFEVLHIEPRHAAPLTTLDMHTRIRSIDCSLHRCLSSKCRSFPPIPRSILTPSSGFGDGSPHPASTFGVTADFAMSAGQ